LRRKKRDALQAGRLRSSQSKKAGQEILALLIKTVRQLDY
jgi:hypothetical protein